MAVSGRVAHGEVTCCCSTKSYFTPVVLNLFVLSQHPLPIYSISLFTLSRFGFNAFWFVCLNLFISIFSYGNITFDLRIFLFTSCSSGTQPDR